VDAQLMRRLAESARVGHLGTVSAEGRPHIVPVCFVIIGETAYSAVDHKPKRTALLQRIANLAATGHACLLVDHYADDWSALWWVRLDGHGRVVSDPGEATQSLAGLRNKYPQYAQLPASAPVLAVDVTHWSGWTAAGHGEPGR
jgi:PPOX class probable F420-dependent enzyme